MVKMKKTVKCPECEGNGYIQWGDRYDEIEECSICEGHGEWLEDEEEMEEKLQEFKSAVENIKAGVLNKEVKPENLKSGAVDKALLDRVKEAGPEIRQSLLEKGEE